MELCRYYGRGHILRILWSETAATLANISTNGSSDLPDAYKRLAANLLGTHHLCNDLWSGGLLRIPKFNSDRASPLVYAVSTQDNALFKLVMEHCRTLVPNRTVSFNVHDALDLALKHSQADFSCKILSVMRVPDLVRKDAYIRWLNLAILLVIPECVKMITERCPAG